ncbi:hypothetical protein [Mesomycoplasma hyorhinis]|nr:hypothetical protein [Mesomycoplasma hyorhinis]
MTVGFSEVSLLVSKVIFLILAPGTSNCFKILSILGSRVNSVGLSCAI